jgi:hypothetical protein
LLTWIIHKNAFADLSRPGGAGMKNSAASSGVSQGTKIMTPQAEGNLTRRSSQKPAKENLPDMSNLKRAFDCPIEFGLTGKMIFSIQSRPCGTGFT